MLLQFLRIPLARDADHKSKTAAGAGLNPGDCILDDDRPRRLNPEQLCRIKNVSGAGFPARFCVSTIWPSTRTSKSESNLAAFRTAEQFSLEVTRAILNPSRRNWSIN